MMNILFLCLNQQGTCYYLEVDLKGLVLCMKLAVALLFFFTYGQLTLLISCLFHVICTGLQYAVNSTFALLKQKKSGTGCA